MSTPRLSRIKAEHPTWTIERTPDRRTIGYTATRNAEGDTAIIRAVSLTELEKRLHSGNPRATNASRRSCKHSGTRPPASLDATRHWRPRFGELVANPQPVPTMP